jgi:hypothetical protein
MLVEPLNHIDEFTQTVTTKINLYFQFVYKLFEKFKSKNSVNDIILVSCKDFVKYLNQINLLKHYFLKTNTLDNYLLKYLIDFNMFYLNDNNNQFLKSTNDYVLGQCFGIMLNKNFDFDNIFNYIFNSKTKIQITDNFFDVIECSKEELISLKNKLGPYISSNMDVEEEKLKFMHLADKAQFSTEMFEVRIAEMRNKGKKIYSPIRFYIIHLCMNLRHHDINVIKRIDELCKELPEHEYTAGI